MTLGQLAMFRAYIHACIAGVRNLELTEPSQHFVSGLITTLLMIGQRSRFVGPLVKEELADFRTMETGLESLSMGWVELGVGWGGEGGGGDGLS